jgi:hypothetical protein
MSAAKWILIGMYVFSMIYTITLIGKPRKPYTPEAVAVSSLFSLGMIALVIVA